MDVLAPDVVLLGDGGGVKQALPRPVVGVDKVSRLLGVSLARARELGMVAEVVQVNGWPALVLRVDGITDSVMSVCVEDGQVTAVYTVRNPHKLSHVITEAALHR